MGGQMMFTPNENTTNSQSAVERNENARDSCLQGAWYEIRVKGHLGREWADWFEGLEFKPFEDGQMLLSGRIVDQSALIGVLIRLNRLNLALLSVRSLGE
jgi:hypothetical protein